MREDFGRDIDSYALFLDSLISKSKLKHEMNVIKNEYESFDEYGIWKVAVDWTKNTNDFNCNLGISLMYSKEPSMGDL
jgi:hypothetical protein